MKITTLIGPLCSGKSYQLRINYQHSINVDVGDIVREIKQREGRVFDLTLDQEILVRLESCVIDAINQNKDIVIAGIRQLTILQGLESFIKAQSRIESSEIKKYSRIFLSVPYDIRKQRFARRSAEKDNNLSFEECEEKDKQLGLQQVIDYCLNQDSKNTIIKS